MSYRFMRILVFFDLPTVTDEDRREYRRFRKQLLKQGFFMLQESVYCRMTLNQRVTNSVLANLRIMKPSKGLVQAILVTEKQFSKMEIMTGEYKSDVVDSAERTIFL